MTGITDHLGRIRDRIADAAARAGRSADSVRLVAVTKGHPAATLLDACKAGVTDVGENYLQEALHKIAACGDGPVWHFIGNVQSNKTRELANHFSWVQTVASPRVAERLSVQRAWYAPELQICIQVRPPGVVGRAGCLPEDVAWLAAVIAGLPKLRLRGLMTIPPANLDETALRAEFRRMRSLLADLRTAGHDTDTLSMGMSDDFEVAIEEGSTMVRIGTALFGPRPQH